jgi:hypothetical protein
MQNIVVTDEFLLWSELTVLWSFFAYAVASDSLPEDLQGRSFHWQAWQKVLIVRVIGVALLSFLIGHSVILSSWLAAITAIHPWIRLGSPRKWTAELEIAAVISNLILTFAFIKHLHLQSRISIPSAFDRGQLAASSIVIAILLFTVRGGTYIVRGCLRKTGTLPHLSPREASSSKAENHAEEATPLRKHSKSSHSPSPLSPAHEPVTEFVDIIEINRGRLIGNLERLVLTIVVAAGSYAALAFLVAAKGLIRSEDLRDRDFAEYFLIGSLASVLVALCAGLVMRFALSALWPQLLSLQMQ